MSGILRRGAGITDMIPVIPRYIEVMVNLPPVMTGNAPQRKNKARDCGA